MSQRINETPKVELEWVNIRGEGTENMQGRMEYKVNGVFDPEVKEDKEFLDSIETFWDENKPAKIKKCKSNACYTHYHYTGEKDEDGDNIKEETGKVSVAFKTGTTYPDGKEKLVRVYNAKSKEVSISDDIIGNGSIGRISGTMAIYEIIDKKTKKVMEAGVTLYLDAVKILKMEERRSQESFQGEEDGWEGDTGWTGEDTDASQVRV